MSTRAAKWIPLTAVLALCCACAASDAWDSGPIAAPSDAAISTVIESPDPSALYHGETPLSWEIPPADYHIIETLADEDGFAVIYIDLSTEAPPLAPVILVQFLDARGKHAQTFDTGLRGRVQDGPYMTDLTRDRLLFVWRSRHHAVDRATGAVRVWNYYDTLLLPDGFTLDYAVEYSEPMDHAALCTRYRLTDPDGAAREISVPDYDGKFMMALDFLRTGAPVEADWPDITYKAQVRFDAAAKTVTLSNTKRTHTLDFNSLSHASTLRYTDGMLERVIAASPDGGITIYGADSMSLGDGFSQDIVVKWRDGSITLLDTGSFLYGADFMDDNTVVLCKGDALVAFDLTEATPTARQLFDAGSVTEKSGYTHPERLVIGMAVDRENRLLLAAMRDYSGYWDAQMPVTLVVFDAALNQIDALWTDCLIPTFYHNRLMQCDMTLNGDGTAALSWLEEPPVRIRYLPEKTED